MYKVLVAFLLGFFIGVIIMNIPAVMKNSGTYRKIQMEQIMQRRTKDV